jgi:hypothetical protein
MNILFIRPGALGSKGNNRISSSISAWNIVFRLIRLLAVVMTVPTVFAWVVSTGVDHRSSLSFEKGLDPYPHIRWLPDPKISTVHDYANRAKKIFNDSSLSDGAKMYAFNELIATQYRHGELAIPWHYDWLGWLLAYANLPKLRDFDSVVNPDVIARAKVSICNQQAILAAAVLRRLGIDYRTYGTRATTASNQEIGHFVLISTLGNTEYLIDPNRFPSGMDGSGVVANLRNPATVVEEYNKLYADILSQRVIDVDVQIGDMNASIAPRLSSIQSTTYFLSHYGYLILLTLAIFERCASSLFMTKGGRSRPS